MCVPFFFSFIVNEREDNSRRFLTIVLFLFVVFYSLFVVLSFEIFETFVNRSKIRKSMECVWLRFIVVLTFLRYVSCSKLFITNNFTRFIEPHAVMGNNNDYILSIDRDQKERWIFSRDIFSLFFSLFSLFSFLFPCFYGFTIVIRRRKKSTEVALICIVPRITPIN